MPAAMRAARRRATSATSEHQEGEYADCFVAGRSLQALDEAVLDVEEAGGPDRVAADRQDDGEGRARA